MFPAKSVLPVVSKQREFGSERTSCDIMKSHRVVKKKLDLFSSGTGQFVGRELKTAYALFLLVPLELCCSYLVRKSKEMEKDCKVQV